MFKDKAMYVQVVDTKTMQPTSEVIARPSDSIKDVIHDIIAEEGKQVAKIIVTVMAAHFLLSTVSTLIVNSINQPNK